MDPRAIILYSLPLLIGLPLVVYFGGQCWTGLQAHRWPTVRGRLTQFHRTVGPDTSRSSLGLSAFIDVEYEYTVNGRSYKGNRIAVPFPEFRLADVPLTWERGAGVDVHYHPTDPERSLLRPGVRKFSLLVFVIGLMFTVMGVLGVSTLFR